MLTRKWLIAAVLIVSAIGPARAGEKELNEKIAALLEQKAILTAELAATK